MNRCRKCGTPIGENYGKSKNKALRCGSCRKEVDKELIGEQNNPRAYYFSFYLRHRK